MKSLSEGASEVVPLIIANIMTTSQIILTVSLVVAALGVIIEQTSNRRRRAFVNDYGNRPRACYKNLRLMGGFKYKAGTVYYYCLCLGPFVFAPLGCYESPSKRTCDISSAQKGDAWEICALYFRWGWIVALVVLLNMAA